MIDIPDWTTAVQSPQQLLANVAVAANATSNTDFVPPAGTHGVAVHLSGGSAAWSSVALQGLDSGDFYGLQGPNIDVQVDYYFPLLAVAESSWRVQVIRTGAPAGAVSARIVALLDTVVMIAQNPGSPKLQVALAKGGPVATAAYDRVGTASNAAAAATVTLNGVAGKTYVCGYLAGSVYQAVAGAAVVSLRLWDGPSPGGTIKFQQFLHTDGVGDAQQFGLSGLAILGTQGNGMTLDFDASGAGQGESVSLGAWLV